MSALDEARKVLSESAWTGGFADRYLDALHALVTECEMCHEAIEQALAEFDPVADQKDPVVLILREALA